MYTLYFFPDACSLATHAVMRELNLQFDLVNTRGLADFRSINPVGVVPVLKHDEVTLFEGAAIMLYLLENHDNDLFPTEPVARQQAIEDIMFANATMHSAYSKVFFGANHISNREAKAQYLAAAAEHINSLWQVVENKLAEQPFLGGTTPSAADIMLSVYARWNAFFDLEIIIPTKTLVMIDKVQSRPTFQAAIQAEQSLAVTA
ncbi:glutathione S-transferase family protein (plasmid) [Pseudoalteromonas sp. T1lg65]|uniref:glutathione S-transferase family protein n=1 Tax=Pseudoalteromonas sp. T1lg65 TaxID=2077101 RepID=UPI003F7A4CFD